MLDGALPKAVLVRRRFDTDTTIAEVHGSIVQRHSRVRAPTKKGRPVVNAG
jgi:hypothetical protein